MPVAQEIPLIEESIRLFRQKTPTGEIPTELQQYYTWYRQEMATCESKGYYKDFTQEITKLSIKYDIYKTLNVTTTREGAAVKYESILERTSKVKPMEMNNRTNHCTAKLPMGHYYIWCVRNGKSTSDTSKKVQIYENTELQLVEE